MSELGYSDYVNVKIIKVSFMDEPSHWALEITDKHGNDMGMATAPTFAGIYDTAYSIIAGGDKYSGWEVNQWTTFDGNAKNWN